MIANIAVRKFLYFSLICFFSAGPAFSQAAFNNTYKTGVSGYSPYLSYYVVIYRGALGLPDYVVDTVNSRASAAKALLIINPDFDVIEYERKTVRSLLSDDQYCSLLVLKNKPVAAEITRKVWTGMLEKGLVSASDSATLHGRINAHLLTTLLTRDYFAEDPEEQRKYLKELDRKAPSALYEYYHHGYDKPFKGNLYRAEFVW